jgi:penicillin-binding protein 1A
MGYSERKKSLGGDMTGGRGALPIWIDFMKTFLKDKPKENFEKAPKMPEDIRELHLQRQREMAEERESFMAARGDRGDGERLLPTITIEPKLEQITLPPSPGEALTATNPPPSDDSAKKPDTAPARDDDAPPPPAPARARDREPEPPKKKGKKGSDEP